MKGDSFNKSFVLIHASYSLQSEISKKCYFQGFLLNFQAFSSQPIQKRFRRSDLNRKHSTCRSVLK